MPNVQNPKTSAWEQFLTIIAATLGSTLALHMVLVPILSAGSFYGGIFGDSWAEKCLQALPYSGTITVALFVMVMLAIRSGQR